MSTAVTGLLCGAEERRGPHGSVYINEKGTYALKNIFCPLDTI